MYYNHFKYIYNYNIVFKYNLKPPTHVESVPSVESMLITRLFHIICHVYVISPKARLKIPYFVS